MNGVKASGSRLLCELWLDILNIFKNVTSIQWMNLLTEVHFAISRNLPPRTDATECSRAVLVSISLVF